jgi:hypothetical protein
MVRVIGFLVVKVQRPPLETQFSMRGFIYLSVSYRISTCKAFLQYLLCLISFHWWPLLR